MEFRTIKKYAKQWFYIFFICNTLFVGIYLASSFIPSETVIRQLNSARDTGVLKTPEYSIGRSTTGLGMDFGTECIALGIGLRLNPENDRVNKVWSRFDESYLAGEANNTWDPCAGLTEIISPGNNQYEDRNLSSYARNWWGISIFMQVGVALFGLASLKSFLYFVLIVVTVRLYQKFSQIMHNNTVGLFLLGPFILTADFQDLYNVAPYSLFTIQMMLFGNILLKVSQNRENQKFKIFQISVLFGCIYNFMFWFNFHLILVLMTSLIYLTYLNEYSYRKILNYVNVFLLGFVSGFVSTTITKWIIGIIIYGVEVRDQITKAITLRLSTSGNGLNGPLLDYSSSIDFLPIPLRAIALNLMVYASKIIDPRYTNIWTIGLLIPIIILCLVYILKKMNFSFQSAYHYILPATPIILIPFLYYAMTSNHSFNHAAVSYRALPLTLGFILSLSYLSYLRKETILKYRSKSV